MPQSPNDRPDVVMPVPSLTAPKSSRDRWLRLHFSRQYVSIERVFNSRNERTELALLSSLARECTPYMNSSWSTS